MQCPECSTANPEVAQFCYRCGHALKRVDSSKHGRNNSYVVQSSEGVNQFALISTIMPHTNRETADNYRWAMIISALLIVGATALGILSIAIASAAFLIPIAYLVYIYDVNLWKTPPYRSFWASSSPPGARDISVAGVLPVGIRVRVQHLRCR